VGTPGELDVRMEGPGPRTLLPTEKNWLSSAWSQVEGEMSVYGTKQTGKLKNKDVGTKGVESGVLSEYSLNGLKEI
jgi:hypothetical protein